MPRISPLPLALTALFTTAVTLYVLSSPPSPLSANVRGKFSGNRGRMAVPRGLRVGAGKIGVYGMGTMGQNLALNIADKGFDVSVSNRSPGRVDAAEERAQKEGLSEKLKGYRDVESFVGSLEVPRRVVLLVKAGAPVDSAISEISKYMEPGDVLIDGGNEWYENTDRRAEELKSNKGIHYVGMGVSGGSEGARYGPSMMPGGDKDTYDSFLAPILEKVAAQVDEGSCVTYIGPGGAGNYVKMVHNGIEYGDMQLIAEAYDILRTVGGMSNEEISEVFTELNEGPLESFLIELTAKLLKKKDDQTGNGELVDMVSDKTGMKGTGKWTVLDALELGVPVPTIAAALDGRLISGLQDLRLKAGDILKGPTKNSPKFDKKALISSIQQALLASKIVAYAQGMSILSTASNLRGWELNLGEISRIWKGGCIIRAALLDDIRAAYARNPSLENLMMDPKLAQVLTHADEAWRTVVSAAVENGIAAPAISASLGYYDSFRRKKSSANLVQAQRDAFGAHTYERIDMPGSFTSNWANN
ncbi:hypothetical protein AAMO2058_000018600 [Amorphochlora amoebiformis]